MMKKKQIKFSDNLKNYHGNTQFITMNLVIDGKEFQEDKFLIREMVNKQIITSNLQELNKWKELHYN